MTRISASLLTDTLNVITLARETALAKGGQAQAERLTPVVDGLRTLATTPAPMPAAASGSPATPVRTPTDAVTDRGAVITAMAAGGMGEVDIARQLGMTREEVRLMLATRDAVPHKGIPSAQIARRYGA